MVVDRWEIIWGFPALCFTEGFGDSLVWGRGKD
jgi:hypothetical protein